MRTSAEGLLDLRLGGSFTSKSEDSIQFDPDPPVEFETKWKDSFGGGIRGGYWFKGGAKWLGLAGDISYFRPKEDISGEALEIHVIPLSLLLMFRAPLITSDKYPNGRLQPYVAAGPGFFVSVFSLDLDPMFDEEITEASFDVGPDVRGGVAFLASRHFGFFVEYRFTRFEPKYDAEVDTFMGSADFTAETQMETHHVAGGVTFRF
jgi:opacity protein-like surface antigen